MKRSGNLALRFDDTREFTGELPRHFDSYCVVFVNNHIVWADAEASQLAFDYDSR